MLLSAVSVFVITTQVSFWTPLYQTPTELYCESSATRLRASRLTRHVLVPHHEVLQPRHCDTQLSLHLLDVSLQLVTVIHEHHASLVAVRRSQTSDAFSSAITMQSLLRALLKGTETMMMKTERGGGL